MAVARGFSTRVPCVLVFLVFLVFLICNCNISLLFKVLQKNLGEEMGTKGEELGTKGEELGTKGEELGVVFFTVFQRGVLLWKTILTICHCICMHAKGEKLGVVAQAPALASVRGKHVDHRNPLIHCER